MLDETVEEDLSIEELLERGKAGDPKAQSSVSICTVIFFCLITQLLAFLFVLKCICPFSHV